MNISCFFASLFGLGFIRFAPGTLASLAALPMAGAVLILGGVHALLVFSLAVYILGYLATSFALKTTAEADPSFIVVDEVAAQMGVFIVPVIFFPDLVWFPGLYILGFALFRFFDIVKPFNVGVVDSKLDGALGVMLDDVVAAVYSSIILTLVMGGYTFIMKAQPVIAG